MSVVQSMYTGKDLMDLIRAPKQQQESEDGIMSGKNLPGLIQALAYSDAQGSTAAYNRNKMAMEQAEALGLQNARAAIEGGDDPNAKTALRYDRAGIDKGVQTKLMEDIFGQQSNERKAKGYAAWQEGLNSAIQEGLSPETAVPLVMQRLMGDKELGPAVAEALGSDVTSLKTAVDMGIELVQNGVMSEGAQLWQDTLQQITDAGKSGDGISTLLRKPEFLLSRLPKVMTENAIKKSMEVPPPEGMSQEQWTARWVNIAQMQSKYMTDAQGKGSPQKGLDFIKAVVSVTNDASEQFFKQQNIDVDKRGQDITKRGQDLDYNVGMAGVAARNRATSANANTGQWGVTKGEDDRFDLNRNGTIDKGKEQALWKTVYGVSALDSAEEQNTTEGVTKFIMSGGKVTDTNTRKSTVKNKNREDLGDRFSKAQSSANLASQARARLQAIKAKNKGGKK